jgi:hypothetical protein
MRAEERAGHLADEKLDREAASRARATSLGPSEAAADRPA